MLFAVRIFSGPHDFLSSFLAVCITLRHAHSQHISIAGLADTLRTEMLLYDIQVQFYCPNTILTPGYEQENRRKPDITLRIEEADAPISPDAAAKAMLAGTFPLSTLYTTKRYRLSRRSCLLMLSYTGIKNGDPHISGDLFASLFRSAARGSTPYGNVFLENIYGFIGWVS